MATEAKVLLAGKSALSKSEADCLLSVQQEGGAERALCEKSHGH